MKLIGNLIWFVFGGFWGGLAWLGAGLLWSITIIGLPIGLQCFKFARLSFWPFGYDIVYSDSASSFVLNLIWLVVSGIPLAISHAMTALVLLLSIIGIPFAPQALKLARLALAPFGTRIVRAD